MAGHRQTAREPLLELVRGTVEVGIRAPAEVSSDKQYFLRAHLQNDVGVGTDPDTLGGHVTQQGIQERPILPVGDGIDPDEDAVDLEELVADSSDGASE